MIGTVLTQVLNGLSLASILILIALGLAVIFGLLGVINLAHADLFMVGMYTLVQVQAVRAGGRSLHAGHHQHPAAHALEIEGIRACANGDRERADIGLAGEMRSRSSDEQAWDRSCRISSSALVQARGLVSIAHSDPRVRPSASVSGSGVESRSAAHCARPNSVKRETVATVTALSPAAPGPCAR